MGHTEVRPMKIWCLLRDQFDHIRPVQNELQGLADFVYDDAWDPKQMLQEAPDLVLCINEHHLEVTQCILAAQYAGIPTLTVQDGILEWRCQYENPLFGAGGGSPQHQPVFSDKIACIGRQSARQIERWGNPGKCEVIGMPRLDYLISRPRANREPQSPKRLLVMTAKKPGFTDQQMAVTIRSLKDIERFVSSYPDLEVVWRVSKKCEAYLSGPNTMRRPESIELVEVLDTVDAVITTPSTAMLEAMLMGKPVAVLDYHNTPRFVHSAWTISAPEHIPGVIGELLNPPVAKMLFQEDCLHDALECWSPASPRMATLITRMVEIGRQCREQGRRPSFSTRLVVPESVVGEMPPLSLLYPNASVFRELDTVKLQVRLARAENENARLRRRMLEGSLPVKVLVALKNLSLSLKRARRSSL